MKRISILLFLLLTLSGCSNNNYYLSITNTKEENNELISDIYSYDLNKESLSLITSIPYTSNYPLATYNNNHIYYSARSDTTIEYSPCLIKEYDLDTKEDNILVDYVDTINDIRWLDNKLFIVGQLKDVDNHNMVPTIYDLDTKNIEDFNWDNDQFVCASNYNPDDNSIILAHYSYKEKENLNNAYNNEEISFEKTIPTITISKIVNNKISKLYTLNKEVISVYLDNDNLYYTTDNKLICYNLTNNKEETITEDYNLKIIYANKKDLYIINHKDLIKYNLEIKQETTIFTAKNKSAINNIQIYQTK